MRRLASEGLSEDLKRAYTAKLSKTKSGLAVLDGKDDAYVPALLSRTKEIFEALEMDLSQSTGPWICGDKFTVADAFWAISIYRFIVLGCQFFWEGREGDDAWNALPKTTEWITNLLERKSLWISSIEYPGNIFSHGTADLIAKKHGTMAGCLVHRKTDMADCATSVCLCSCSIM